MEFGSSWSILSASSLGYRTTARDASKGGQLSKLQQDIHTTHTLSVVGWPFVLRTVTYDNLVTLLLYYQTRSNAAAIKNASETMLRHAHNNNTRQYRLPANKQIHFFDISSWPWSMHIDKRKCTTLDLVLRFL